MFTLTAESLNQIHGGFWNDDPALESSSISPAVGGVGGLIVGGLVGYTVIKMLPQHSIICRLFAGVGLPFVGFGLGYVFAHVVSE